MRVLLPGSYDPVTLGHLDIVRRVAERGDEVFLVAFVNPEKSYFFTPRERVKMLSLATEDMPCVHVGFFNGRVVDYMRENGIEKIVKGYRNASDLAYEKIQAGYNLENGGFETEFMKSREDFRNISSTAARRLIEKGESLDGILPEKVIEFLRSKD